MESIKEVLTEVAQTLSEQEKFKKIINFKIFNPRKSTFENKIFNLYTHASILLLYTGIAEFELIFKQNCKQKIFNTKDNRTYYIVSLPKEEYAQELFLNVLKHFQIQSTSKLTLPSNYNLFFTPLQNSSKDMDWSERRCKISEQLQKVQTITYTPPKFPTFPLFIRKNNNKASANDFIKKYANLSNKDFIKNALARHILASTHIFEQSNFLNISINKEDLKDLKKLAPPTLQFTSDNLNSFKNSYSQNQRIEIPLTLLENCFKSENLTRTGLKFLLLVLFTYHARARIFNYKPSTIINLCNLTTSKGYPYLLNLLNQYFNYLLKVNIISEPPELSLKNLKQDRTIKLKLNNLKEINLNFNNND